MVETLSVLEPPNKPPLVSTGLYDYDDYIKEIGDQIAKLTIIEAKKLEQYINELLDRH